MVLVLSSSFGAFPPNCKASVMIIYLKELPKKCLQSVLEILSVTWNTVFLMQSKYCLEKHRKYFFVEVAHRIDFQLHKQQNYKNPHPNPETTMNIDGPSMNFVIENVGAQTWAKPSGFSSAAERDQLRGDRAPENGHRRTGTGPRAAQQRPAAPRRARHRSAEATPPPADPTRRGRSPPGPLPRPSVCACAAGSGAFSRVSRPNAGRQRHARPHVGGGGSARWRHPAPGAGGAAAGRGGCGPGRRGAAAGGGIWRRGCPPWLPGSPSRPRPGPTACSARG